MLKRNIIICAIIFSIGNMVSAQVNLDLTVSDAIGTWESALGNNEFIGIEVYRFADDGVAGHFSKYTKDSQGNISSVIYNSQTSEMLAGVDDPALFFISNRDRSLNGDLQYRMIMLLIDRGVSNQLSQPVRAIYVYDDNYFARLFKDCNTCPLQLSWQKSRDLPGGIDVGTPKTQLPDTMLFYKL